MALTGTVYFWVLHGRRGRAGVSECAVKGPQPHCKLLQLTMSSHDHCTLSSIRTQKSDEQGLGSTAKNIRAFNMSTGASLLVQTQFT